MKKIQMVDLQHQYLRMKPEIDDAIFKIISQANFIKGKEVIDFENQLAAFVDAQHCISCGNGTDALQIALMALGLKPGDEVVIPAFTYIATVEVAALLGLKILLADVDEGNFNLSANALETVLQNNKAKAVMPVHLFGQAAPMEEIMDLASQHQTFVVEDNAQALGAALIFKNLTSLKLGTIGHVGCTSFFPSKNLGAFGDGGALFTNNQDLAKKIKSIANHGQSVKYQHDEVGVNSRLDTLQAAILNVKLKELPDFISRRQNVAALYDVELQNLVKIPKREKYSTHVFHQYTIRLESRKQRDDLKAFLQNSEIPTMIYYPIPVHFQPGYAGLEYKKGDFPVAEKLSETVLSLPIHTEMDSDLQEFIVNNIKKFFKQ